MDGYKIGAVSQMTGIAPNTIRVWERRYEAVVPARTSHGGRLYSAEDIARLKLLQQAIKLGDSIGQVANLSDQALIERTKTLSEHHQPITHQAGQHHDDIKLTIAGSTIPDRVKNLPLHQFTTITSVDSWEALEKSHAEPSTSQSQDTEDSDSSINQNTVLLIEVESMNKDICQSIIQVNSAYKPLATIVCYEYGMPSDLNLLQANAVLLVREPADVNTLTTLLNTRQFSKSAIAVEAKDKPESPSVARYSKRQLLALTNIKSNIACECPRHLAELLVSLASFERYSLMCEDRSEDDAALHAMLATATAHARTTMESALRDVLSAEKIMLPNI